MSVKYKIENAKLNKKLVGDTVTVSKIKKSGGRGPKGPNQPTLRELILGLQNDINSLQNDVNGLHKDVSNLQTSVSNIEQTLKRNNIV